MKISKKSWHYRFMCFSEKNPPPDNLCSYVGNLIGFSLFSLFAILSMLLFFGGPIILIIIFFGVTPVLVAGFSLSVAMAIDKASGYLVPFKPKEERPKEPKTLLGKWLKAKTDE